MQINPSRTLRGFTLVEMAIVLLIAGVAAGLLFGASTGMIDAQKRKSVRTQLNTIDAALELFVAKNKRLPCPADGTIASGAVNAGVETLVVATGLCSPALQTNGVIPWVTLGLAENESDPWFGRFTYRVDPALAGAAPLPLVMDMTNCDPSGTGPTGAGGICGVPVAPCVGSVACTSPTSFLANKGLDVWNGVGGAAGWATRQNNRALGTGAAYVVISHGTTGAGAYNKNGAAGPAFATQPGTLSIPNPAPPPVTLVAGNDEIPNMNNRVIALPSAQGTTYRDAPLNDVVSAAHFDDFLSHPTISWVLKQANLGPRAH